MQFLKRFAIVALVLTCAMSVLGADAKKDEPKDEDVKVFTTKSGEKYHVKECRALSEKSPLAVALAEAKKNNLTACAICKPDLTVYVLSSGEKYHLKECRFVSDKAVAMSLAAAETKGKQPCKVCNPPDGKAEKADKKGDKADKKMDN